MNNILLVVLCILLLACDRNKLWGTNTGNPGEAADTQFQPGAPNKIYSQELGKVMCAKLAICNAAMDLNLCNQEIINVNAIVTEMAVSAPFQNLNEMISAEVVGTLGVNKEKVDLCLTAIQETDCSDSNVQNAYSPSQATQFNNTYFLIRLNSNCVGNFN
jgi:hypothetical protein